VIHRVTSLVCIERSSTCKLSGWENIFVKELRTINGNTGPRVLDDLVSRPAFRPNQFACRLTELALRDEVFIEENVEQIQWPYNVNVVFVIVSQPPNRPTCGPIE
jgi:hypothetical protein